VNLLFTVWGGIRGERTPYEDLYIAGAELACRQHAETLASYGHRVVFTCWGPADRDTMIDSVRVVQRRHPLFGKQIGRSAFWTDAFEEILSESVAGAVELVRQEGINAIYTRVLWPTGLIGYRVQEQTRVDCAASVDDKVFVEQLLDGPDLLPEAVREYWVEQMTRAIEGLGRLVLLAPHLQQQIARFSDRPAPATVIPSGFDPQRFVDVEPVDWRKRFEWPAGRRVLLCAARLDPPKRQDLLIESVARLVDDGVDLGLVLIGAGCRRDEWEARCRRLGIADRTRFVGCQPNATIPAALAGADVIATPTDWEAFPIQLLEALASGKPMVVSDAPPYDAILAGQDVIPVCENNRNAWTRGLQRALSQLEEGEQTGRRAYAERLLAEFTQESTSRRIEAVLAELCDAGCCH
jgi:glycosyltransferase involved in cell wall biosynthesis